MTSPNPDCYPLAEAVCPAGGGGSPRRAPHRSVSFAHRLRRSPDVSSFGVLHVRGPSTFDGALALTFKRSGKTRDLPSLYLPSPYFIISLDHLKPFPVSPPSDFWSAVLSNGTAKKPPAPPMDPLVSGSDRAIYPFMSPGKGTVHRGPRHRWINPHL